MILQIAVGVVLGILTLAAICAVGFLVYILIEAVIYNSRYEAAEKAYKKAQGII
jgi:hypothetical protein